MTTLTAIAICTFPLRQWTSGGSVTSIVRRHLILCSLILAILWCTFIPPISQAAIVSYQLTYSGASLGNSATATGQVSFDDRILPNGPVSLINVSATTLGVTDWSLTVSGASSGNGTFNLPDLQTVRGQEDGWVWVLDSPIDLSAELVGQVGFTDFNWCALNKSCGSELAPGGVGPIRIGTNGETGQEMLLISMVPVRGPSCGDFDQDQDVDSADLVDFLAAWTGEGGTGATRERGDCDVDGDVDSADMLTFLSNWTGSAESWRVASVPEPASGSMVGVAIAGLLLAQRRRRV